MSSLFEILTSQINVAENEELCRHESYSFIRGKIVYLSQNFGTPVARKLDITVLLTVAIFSVVETVVKFSLQTSDMSCTMW